MCRPVPEENARARLSASGAYVITTNKYSGTKTNTSLVLQSTRAFDDERRKRHPERARREEPRDARRETRDAGEDENSRFFAYEALHSFFLRVATQTTYFFANRSPTARMSVTTASAPSRPVFAVSS